MKMTRLPNGAGTVKLNTDMAEDMAKGFSAKMIAKVGILGSKAARSEEGGDQTNADIGLLHEKGSLVKHIPRRSFLEVPLVQHAKELAAVGQALKKWIAIAIDKNEEAKVAWQKAHRDLGIAGEAIVQKAFRTRGFGDWAPNSPRTIERKGSDSPLIDTAQLRRSITSQVVEKE